MKIQSIHIENFRSIKSLDFEPDPLTAIIGPNGTGKTNILLAIDYVLGEGWTTKAKITRELFNDPEKPLKIEITLSSPVLVQTNPNYKPAEISSIKLEMGLNPPFAKTTYNQGNTFYGQEQFKKACHYLYLPADRQLSDELRVSAWTMLGKLMNQVYESYVDYKQNKSKLTEEFRKKILPAKEFLEEDFPTNDGQFSFHKFAEVFTKHCQNNSTGFSSSFIPELEIYNMNMFYKTLQIHVKEELFDNHFNSDQVGAGMQNLLVLSIFQTYAELMGGRVILGIEEPELYLYPQAQRALYTSFIKMSESTQILYTTHSPNFVSAARPDDINLVRCSRGVGTHVLEKGSYFTNSHVDKERFSIYTHFDSTRNELFFSKKVLLVEGHSDKIFFETLCKNKWSVNIDKEGYSIIECGGKEGVNYFIGVCELIGLQDYFAVWDQDDTDYKPNEKENLSETIAKGKGIEIPGNLERFIGLPSSNKIVNAHKWASEIDPANIPSLLLPVKYFFNPEEAKTVVSYPKTGVMDDLPF